jgi:hypothetical protein
MRALPSSGICSLRHERLHCWAENRIASSSGSSFLDGVDVLLRGRAPGASTYIRQLPDGLPQSCVHEADNRGDGFTLFTGVVKAPIEASMIPPPRLRGRSARSSVLEFRVPSGSASRRVDALGHNAGFHVPPERNREFAGHGDNHDPANARRLIARPGRVPTRQRACG